MVRMSLRRNVQVQHRSENSQQQHRRKLLGKAVLACIYLTVGIVLALTLFGYHSILHHSTERAIANQSAKERRHQHARQIPDEDKIIDHTTVFMNRPTKPLVIAYAISLIKVRFCQRYIRLPLNCKLSGSNQPALGFATVRRLSVQRGRLGRRGHRAATFHSRDFLARWKIALRLQDVCHCSPAGPDL